MEEIIKYFEGLEERIATLEAQVASLEAEVDELKSRPAPEPKVVEKVVEKIVEKPVVQLVEKPVIQKVYRTKYIQNPFGSIVVGVLCFLAGIAVGYFL